MYIDAYMHKQVQVQVQVQRPRCKKCTCADACIYICVHGDVCIMFLCMFIYIYMYLSQWRFILEELPHVQQHPMLAPVLLLSKFLPRFQNGLAILFDFHNRSYGIGTCVYTCISVYLVFNMQMKLHRCSCTGHTHTHINYRTWRLPDGLRLPTKSPLLSGAQMGQKKMPKNAIHNSQ